jgi:hypothetical protein
MSKMGNLRIEAEEQVEYFSKADFVKVFGHGSDEIWDEHHGSDDPEDYKKMENKNGTNKTNTL